MRILGQNRVPTIVVGRRRGLSIILFFFAKHEESSLGHYWGLNERARGKRLKIIRPVETIAIPWKKKNNYTVV